MNLAALRNLRVSTKSLVSALFAFGAAMQIPAVSTFVYQQTASHPRIASALTAVLGIVALLHNPQVQAALGIEQTVTVETKTVDLAPVQPPTKP